MPREEEVIRESLRDHGFKYLHPRRLSRNVWVYIIAVILLMQALKTVWRLPSAAEGEDFSTGFPLGAYIDYHADFGKMLPGFTYVAKTKAAAAWYFRCGTDPAIGVHFIVNKHYVTQLYVTSSFPTHSPPPDVVKLATKRGVHLGSRRLDVLARYGYPAFYDARTERGYTLMMYRFPSSLLSFRIDANGIVSEMSLSRAYWPYYGP